MISSTINFVSILLSQAIICCCFIQHVLLLSSCGIGELECNKISCYTPSITSCLNYDLVSVGLVCPKGSMYPFIIYAGCNGQCLNIQKYLCLPSPYAPLCMLRCGSECVEPTLYDCISNTTKICKTKPCNYVCYNADVYKCIN